jgi:signal transduction histidine kinase
MSTSEEGPAPSDPTAPPGGGGSGAGRSGDDEGARELLAAIFESSAAGLAILVGRELRFALVNPAYRALCPRPEIDPTGSTFAETWPMVDPAAIEAGVRVLETGEPAHSEDFPLEIRGTTRWFSYHLKRVTYTGLDALLVAMWETTAFVQARQSAERAAEQALRRAAELDAVIDAIADGFVLFGPRGEVLRINRTAARMLLLVGVDARRAFGPGSPIVAETAEGKFLPEAEWPVARALAGDVVLGLHLHLRLPGGVSTWISASAAPIVGPDGKRAGAVLTFSDESAVHALEEARDDLVRMISHDLRTPLNAIYTQAHLLRRAPQDPQRVTERAQSIVRSSERMSSMIHDLVETMLLEARQLPLDRAPVDVAALVGDLLGRLGGGLQVERVRVEIAAGLPRAYADLPRLERIVVNLLSNALKYSPAESEVTLSLAPSGEGLLLTVSDRGVGIAPEDQRQIFERYYRTRGARQPEGLGLGLYITRLLVEAHGGRIEVESQLGQGSTFRVFLPAALQDNRPPA